MDGKIFGQKFCPKFFQSKIFSVRNLFCPKFFPTKKVLFYPFFPVYMQLLSILLYLCCIIRGKFLLIYLKTANKFNFILGTTYLDNWLHIQPTFYWHNQSAQQIICKPFFIINKFYVTCIFMKLINYFIHFFLLKFTLDPYNKSSLVIGK